MEKILANKKLVLPLLITLFCVFLAISLTSEGTFDAGDGIRHYLVSRYSWTHPELFLYSWGKPFFTAIASPFSQFGLIGINIFNVLCGLVSAFLCYKIALKLNLKYPVLAIIFLLFTPSYFPALNSGLTEPFFGLVLISSIYLLFQERYLISSVIISFLPFVRTEGNFILLLFLALYLYRKKFIYIPVLGFGTLVYTLIGYIYYKDFFWIKNQNPYTGHNADIYGSGELLHFVKNHNFLWGTSLLILFLAGCLSFLWIFFKRKTIPAGQANKFFPEELILIFGSFSLYFFAHSIFWWKGLVGSLGLLRVMAAVMPCSAIICLRGFNLIGLPIFKRYVFLEYIIIPIMLFLVVYSPFKHEYFPYKLDQEQALVKEAGDWYKNSSFTGKKVYYLYPYFAHVLEIDPFDEKKVGELWGLYPTIKEWGIDAIPDSTVVLWDAHFGPNECHLPLETIMNDPNFQLVKSFSPEHPFTVLGGYNFEIHVFIKTKNNLVSLHKQLHDLESQMIPVENIQTLTKDVSYSGEHGSLLTPKEEYSSAFVIKCDTLKIAPTTKRVILRAKVKGNIESIKTAMFVLSVDDNGKNLFWSGQPLSHFQDTDKAEWKLVEATYVVGPDILKSAAKLKFYIWNKEKKEFVTDDFEIEFIGDGS